MFEKISPNIELWCILLVTALFTLISNLGIWTSVDVSGQTDFCTNYMNRFSPPSDGYVRYKDDSCTFTMDYPSDWKIDMSHNTDYNHTRTSNIIFTDGSSSSVTVSMTMGLSNDNSVVFSFNDIKNAIASRDTTLRDISNISNIFDFQYSNFEDGNFIDFRPSITASTTSDLGFMKVKKEMYATIAYPWGCCWPQHAANLLVFTTQGPENGEKSSILKHMIDSVHVMNQS